MDEASRKVVFRIHAWIGLNFGYLLFLVCLSGTAAVFSSELSWLADPALRAESPAAAKREAISWQEMYDRVVATHPRALPLYLNAAPDDRSAMRATISYAPSDFRSVLVNPHNGEVQGLRGSFNLVSFFRIFHKQFYVVPSEFGFHGTLIVGTLGILLLVGTIAGLLSIKRWWRALVTLRLGRSRRLFWSDLHRLTGAWCFAIAVFLSLTGVWYLAERVLFDTGGLVEESAPIRLSDDDMRVLPAILSLIDLDRAVALAREAYPDLAVTQIALPARANDPLTLSGHAGSFLVRDHADKVLMNPYTGAILDVRRTGELGAFERWIETADPLHFGDFAGIVSQVVWLITGLMTCCGILAGLYSAWLRLRLKRGRGWSRGYASTIVIFPTLLVLAASLYGTYTYGGGALREAQRPRQATPTAIGTLGPWPISLVKSDLAEESSGHHPVSILFSGAGRPNLDKAMVWLGDAPERRPAKILVDRLLTDVPASCVDGRIACRVNVSVTTLDGVEHATGIVLPSPTETNWFDLPITPGLNGTEAAIIALFVLCALLPLLGWIRLLLQ